MFNKKLEKYRATLLGCAIGDILGMPVEGWKREQIKKYCTRITEPIPPVLIRDEDGKLIESDEFGKLKYYGEDLKKGEYTDDTILTLAIAKSISEIKDLSLEDIAERHVIEYRIRLKPDGGVVGGFGKTTMEGIQNLIVGKSPYNSGVIGGPGNAPAMKMSPIGLFMNATSQYQKGLQFAYNVGKLTHLDPRSIVSGIIQAHAIYSLLEDVSKNEFLHSLESIAKEYESPLDESFVWHHQGDLKSRILWIKENKDVSSEEAFTKLGASSAVYRSYPFALFMFQKFWDNPLEGLIETVNYGGDCDTTGAIYGALAGAKNGIFFPDKWQAILKDREEIISLANKIYSLGAKNE